MTDQEPLSDKIHQSKLDDVYGKDIARIAPPITRRPWRNDTGSEYPIMPPIATQESKTPSHPAATILLGLTTGGLIGSASYFAYTCLQPIQTSSAKHPASHTQKHKNHAAAEPESSHHRHHHHYKVTGHHHYTHNSEHKSSHSR